MFVRKFCYISLITIWITFLYYYGTILGLFKPTLKIDIEFESSSFMDIHSNKIEKYNGTEDYLINTPGCYIPNYGKTLKFREADIVNKSCGQRAIFLDKVSDNFISVFIDDIKMKKVYAKGKTDYQCCYQFVIPSVIDGRKDHRKIQYSSCEPLKNQTTVKLKAEIIVIKCTTSQREDIYEDAYVFVKKIMQRKNLKNSYPSEPWNILIVGMDTMSRARLLSSMPKTANYIRNNMWLDFKGYQKIGYNTFPNIMALMTGKNMSEVWDKCRNGLDKCNDIFLWSLFNKSGYKTAVGEDFLRLPDTFTKFNGFKNAPTDHYMRPFFLTGEHSKGNIVCAKRKPSAKHVLDYALDFSTTYKNDNFFGLFWLNSFSHNLQNVPSLIDADVVDFFDSLHKNGVLNNTFVLFLSDHGLRYGEMRIPYESYYEERLPMLFVWVPFGFKKKYEFYTNLLTNQNRLITPYDLYATMISILEIAKLNEIISQNQTTSRCPHCISIFNKFSPQRTCLDVNVPEKWCSCHPLAPVKKSELGTISATKAAVNDIHSIIRSIETQKCMQCADLQLKKIIRSHKYKNFENATIYVIAFEMEPGDVSYEASIKQSGKNFSVLDTTQTISVYNTRGNCVKNPVHRAYCVCVPRNDC